MGWLLGWKGEMVGLLVFIRLEGVVKTGSRADR